MQAMRETMVARLNALARSRRRMPRRDAGAAAVPGFGSDARAWLDSIAYGEPADDPRRTRRRARRRASATLARKRNHSRTSQVGVQYAQRGGEMGGRTTSEHGKPDVRRVDPGVRARPAAPDARGSGRDEGDGARRTSPRCAPRRAARSARRTRAHARAQSGAALSHDRAPAGRSDGRVGARGVSRRRRRLHDAARRPNDRQQIPTGALRARCRSRARRGRSSRCSPARALIDSNATAVSSARSASTAKRGDRMRPGNCWTLMHGARCVRRRSTSRVLRIGDRRSVLRDGATAAARDAQGRGSQSCAAPRQCASAQPLTLDAEQARRIGVTYAAATVGPLGKEVRDRRAGHLRRDARPDDRAQDRRLGGTTVRERHRSTRRRRASRCSRSTRRCS